jgi:thiamine biosynthesis lipoprotein
MHLVHLDREQFTVRFEREGVMLDLGAIGKGYAIDRAIEILREAGISNALVHGGTSTIYGLGHPQDVEGWKVSIPRPQTHGTPEPGQFSTSSVSPFDTGHGGLGKEEGQLEPSPAFATVLLNDSSLSVSAVWGKSFNANGKIFGHIIDPRSGQPANNAIMSAVVLPAATETDAISTALLTLGPAGHDRINNLRPNMKTLVVVDSNGQYEIKSKGIAVGIA